VADSFERYEFADDPIVEIERTVRAAAGYVRASDDLRPRVLESARSERCERRARGWIRQAAVFVVLLAISTASMRSTYDSRAGFYQANWLFAGSEAIFARAGTKTAHGGDLAWGLVDSFAELRRRQADAFNLAP
jgi:hypothetical protein